MFSPLSYLQTSWRQYFTNEYLYDKWKPYKSQLQQLEEHNTRVTIKEITLNVRTKKSLMVRGLKSTTPKEKFRKREWIIQVEHLTYVAIGFLLENFFDPHNERVVHITGTSFLCFYNRETTLHYINARLQGEFPIKFGMKGDILRLCLDPYERKYSIIVNGGKQHGFGFPDFDEDTFHCFQVMFGGNNCLKILTPEEYKTVDRKYEVDDERKKKCLIF